MVDRNYSVTGSVRQESLLASHKVLRNTYMLLSLTLLFSALTATFAVVTNAPPLGLFSLLIYFGLFFLTAKLQNSVWGLVSVFALTGFMGYTLGPLLSMFLGLANGPQLIATALFGTGVIFLGLSAYVLTTRKDFTFLGGFVMVGMLVVIMAVLANFFLQIPALTMALSAAIILLMSAFILWETSNIINGGETNYIMATVGLYVSLYNIFTSLLMLLGIFGGDD
jgi:modulator of FtsH protease